MIRARLFQVQETLSVFHPHAQRNAFRHGARQQRRSVLATGKYARFRR
jgi:hypothetical protein